MTNPIPSPESPKSEWRAWALATRRTLDLPTLSEQLCATLEPALAGARHILLYAASPLELDVLNLSHPRPLPPPGTRKLVGEERGANPPWFPFPTPRGHPERTPGRGVRGEVKAQFYLPRCAPERRLAIHAYPCPLTLGSFGIREPHESVPEVSPEILDLVLVPALVIDERGYRLGYGAGYYDRFLPKLPKTCRTFGIAPFLVPKLPTDSWDVPVDGIFVPKVA